MFAGLKFKNAAGNIVGVSADNPFPTVGGGGSGGVTPGSTVVNTLCRGRVQDIPSFQPDVQTGGRYALTLYTIPSGILATSTSDGAHL